MSKKYYLTEDIARACGVSGNTIRWWIYQGYIRDVKKDTSGRRIFTPEDMDRFIVYANSRGKKR